jgi:asparagine synthase (glutamine-hydrolysing)
MCGIAGVLHANGAPVAPELVQRMTESIRHRGPDDDGLFLDRGIGLGFRRLSIIDLGGGHQPMTSLCGRYTIIFNGEIYNYRELRQELQSRHSVSFRTSSDTEVILAAYAAWGPEALKRLNGMFAVALWDAREQCLLLARDRLGKKPLFFARVPRGLVFASEVKALLRHPEVSSAVEAARIPTLLAYRYVPGFETLFREVECLPPASFITVSESGRVSSPQSYWDYEFLDAPGTNGDQPSPRTLTEDLAALLTDAVRLRMIADVPVGAFLSGGIDSSLVVALMSRLHPRPLKTFAIGFDTGVSEADHARMVAKRFGTDHHEIIVGSRDLMAHIPRVLYARETPITEPSDIPIYMLSGLARTRVTVVLSGEGSDEIFAGYPKYAFQRRFAGPLSVLPPALLEGVAHALPFRLRRAQLALRTAAQRDRLERHASWFGAFGPAERNALLAAPLRHAGAVHGYSEQAVLGKAFPSAVEEMLYLDTRHWLPANLLLRGDRMTMAHSLELRCPYLDYRLVEFAANRIPRAQKIRGLTGKAILREVARPILPAETLDRRKWGFKVPIDEWFRGPLLGVLREVLLSPRAIGRGYFEAGKVRQLIDAHASGRTNLEKQLWILLQLELWHLMFVDRTMSAADELGAAA